MYHTSELFWIKDVLEIYTQQNTMNACYLSRVKGQQVLVDHKVKKFTELLPCIFAMYDCRQPKDVSSVESVHMVTEILTQVFIRCCHLNLQSLSNVVPQAFDALELKGPLYMTSYIVFT